MANAPLVAWYSMQPDTQRYYAQIKLIKDMEKIKEQQQAEELKTTEREQLEENLRKKEERLGRLQRIHKHNKIKKQRRLEDRLSDNSDAQTPALFLGFVPLNNLYVLCLALLIKMFNETIPGVFCN